MIWFPFRPRGDEPLRFYTKPACTFVVLFRVRKCLQQHRIFIQLFFLDCLVYPNKVLVHYATCPDIHMANFGIAHLSRRQTNS